LINFWRQNILKNKIISVKINRPVCFWVFAIFFSGRIFLKNKGSLPVHSNGHSSGLLSGHESWSPNKSDLAKTDFETHTFLVVYSSIIHQMSRAAK
jgi:hypothetical protein